MYRYVAQELQKQTKSYGSSSQNQPRHSRLYPPDCKMRSKKMKADIKLRYKNILLRDFRTVKDGEIINFNIGTAAHGPATLAVLKKYLPQEVKISSKESSSATLESKAERAFFSSPCIANPALYNAEGL